MLQKEYILTWLENDKGGTFQLVIHGNLICDAGQCCHTADSDDGDYNDNNDEDGKVKHSLSFLL